MARNAKAITALARLLQTASAHHAVNGRVDDSVICEARAELAWKHVKRAIGFASITLGGAP